MIFIRLPAQKSRDPLGRKGFEIFLRIFSPKNFVKKGEFTFCLLDIFCNITGVCYNAGGSHSVRGRGGVAVVLSLPPGGRVQKHIGSRGRLRVWNGFMMILLCRTR